MSTPSLNNIFASGWLNILLTSQEARNTPYQFSQKWLVIKNHGYVTLDIPY
jgi:hypothetical protein